MKSRVLFPFAPELVITATSRLLRYREMTERAITETEVRSGSCAYKPLAVHFTAVLRRNKVAARNPVSTRGFKTSVHFLPSAQCAAGAFTARRIKMSF
jgi:hypothetical protein